MAKDSFQFEDFLSRVNKDYCEFVSNIHTLLLQEAYKVKVESKASGFFVSYSHPKTKRSLLNFLFRKEKLLVRIYADGLANYSDLLDRISPEMEKEIARAQVCKRLINPEECNPKCIMGYDFKIKGKHYQKCRYNCFQFEVNPASIPVLSDLIENERRERQQILS
jgi:hypothetical protein